MAAEPVVAGQGDDFTLDAGLVARGFGCSVAELRDFMRRGLVTSRVERGEGNDDGTWRLSILFGNRRWQAIIGRDGMIADQRVDFPPAAARR